MLARTADQWALRPELSFPTPYRRLVQLRHTEVPVDRSCSRNADSLEAARLLDVARWHKPASYLLRTNQVNQTTGHNTGHTTDHKGPWSIVIERVNTLVCQPY